MNIDNLTIGEAKQLASLFGNADGSSAAQKINNGMIGKFVIVRCHDAGVHAGVLKDYNGRECLLQEARRLWYWKPANRACNLSGAATEGLDNASQLGAPVNIHLTENCEIIECTDKAAQSIRELPTFVRP